MALRPNPFHSAKLKVERANSHIENLQAVLASFSAEKFYEFVVDGNPASLFTRLIKPFPHDIPLIIGDAVHNLKSSLDHIATAILQSSDVKMADRLFPFHKDRKGLVADTSRLDPIENSLAGAKRLIIDQIQPYSGGNGNLYFLHLLDRIDKHNEIITIAAIAFANRLVVRELDKIVFAANRVIFDVKNPILSIAAPHQFSVDYDSEPSLEVRFGEGLPLGKEPVVPTLIELSQRIGEIIELFVALTRIAEPTSSPRPNNPLP